MIFFKGREPSGAAAIAVAAGFAVPYALIRQSIVLFPRYVTVAGLAGPSKPVAQPDATGIHMGCPMRDPDRPDPADRP
ncbi:hypothetical protein GCM10011505_19800 [Tistrella bauzanensis]|uniref:Uncharacterized protein n=1 Tax=Tistrella bauzanensis TaxID=657419 RepID=A0ABQ1IFQ0_9PROT|nr:hypothetical protein GCM10011505_19800 [Tistrella bauzanensis]